MNRLSFRTKTLIGIVISVIFIYLAFKDVNFEEMWQALLRANYWWLVPALAFMLISHGFRALRWRYFMAPIKTVRVHPLFSALMIGYASNNILPLRLGEFLRAFAIGKSQNISKTSAFATVIVERLIDVLSLLIVLAIAILVYPLPQAIKNGGYVIFAFTVGAIVLLVLLMKKKESTLNLMSKMMPSKLFGLIEPSIRSFLQGFSVLRKSEHYLSITITSVLVWVFYILVVYVSFFAFDFYNRYGLDIWASFVVLGTVSIGIMIPSSPGYVGTYHWFCMKSLSFYGIPESEALSFAVISHALNTIPFTVLGLLYFWRENLRFSDAVAEKELVEEEEAAVQPSSNLGQAG